MSNENVRKLRERAAWLLNSPTWQVHPDSMSHDGAGSLYVWAQDAAGVLTSLATPPAQDTPAAVDEEPLGLQYHLDTTQDAAHGGRG